MKLCYHYILATLLALTLAACSNEEHFEDFTLEDGFFGETPISFSISMGEGKEATRAENTNGEEYDNVIDLNDVRILVYLAEDDVTTTDVNEKGTFVCEAKMPFRSKESKYYRYKFSGGVENVDPSKLYSFVALCNTQNALKVNLDDIDFKNYTLDELLNTLTYSGYTSTFTQQLIAGNALIPMWGVVTVYPEDAEISVTTENKGADGASLDNDENQKLSGFSSDGSIEIPVQRALAKVQIKLSTETAQYFSLTTVELNHANQSGTLVPEVGQRYKTTTFPETGNVTISNTAIKGYYAYANRYTENSQDYPKYLATNNNSDYKLEVNIPTFATSISSGLTFTKVDDNTYVILVPEYRNLKDAANNLKANLETDYAKMSLTFSPLADGVATAETTDDETYDLHFANYTQSPLQYFDIVRNTLYDYTVSLESGRLEANVRVMPWEYETMEYELSQNAAVVLTSEASAVFNTTLSRWSNEVLYSADDASSGYASFTFKVEEPAGVRWVAHLTDPYNFTFTTGSETYGFGGTNKEYTITVKPRGKFSKVLETDLYFTIETLLDTEADITPVDANGNYVTGDYGIANRRIHIAQVETRTGDTGDEVPFRVDMSAWGAAVSSGDNKIAGAKTGYYSYSGLSYPTGIETKTIYTGTTGAMCNNGVVMAAYNGTLYCMWQTSATKEDTPDTHIHYSTLTDGGTTWSEPQNLTTPNASSEGYTSSGGWLVTDDKLIAYVNTWLEGTKTSDTEWTTKPAYGKTRYIDMSNTSEISDVTMDMDGSSTTLTAIFEQDPHVITLPNGTKRIINAGHFQNIASYSNGLYVNPIYADYTDDGITGWEQADFSFTELNGTQSREMEPSIFQKANGDLVMIFRDNMKINESGNDGERYTHRVRASVSHDYGLTWSDPVETNLYDSKSKQCAGNLPDGTAFIVNNPVQSETRSPLVIHLSKDGETFSQSYLLRTGYTKTVDTTGGIQDRRGSAGSGYCYPKAMVHGDYLYVSYSTNKEDVEYTRIPLSSIQLNDPSAR